LNQLAAGRIPWRKTWTSGLPKSLTTSREYRGINILILGTATYTSRYWVTYREALRLGGYVRKGEKSTPVVYWKWRTDEDMQKLRDKTGKELFAPCVPFVSAVFNLDQVEQVKRPEDDVPFLPTDRIEIAERVYAGMPDKPITKHAATYQPVYVPSLDEVLMPHREQFESGPAYYAALFHELAHSTGHAKRLNRFKDAEGGRIEKYSFEELVAEFCATFLCGFAGIENPEADALHAGYIQGWMTALKNDVRLALRAASAAQRAADYIRGKIEPED
jgi:antirestriction protein ArdC